jgi:pyruvate-ferredoxin/flavodoxin oxidoreductase
LKKGGTFLLNSIWDVEETKKRFLIHMKKYMAENEIKFYIINATEIAEEIGLGTIEQIQLCNRLSSKLQT